MRIMFYMNYALRNLWRSRRWSAFAMFSVAAGVATMVALRSLGLSIGDSLLDDAAGSFQVLSGRVAASFGAGGQGNRRPTAQV